MQKCKNIFTVVFFGLIVGYTVSFTPRLEADQPAAGPSSQLDWSKIADSTEWSFDKLPAGPLGGNWADIDKYTLRFDIKPKTGKIDFQVVDDGKTVYSWIGHAQTVFRISGTNLYYADYSCISNGGDLVAVDLKSGHTLWRSPIVAVKANSYSAYSNEIRVQLGVDVIDIWGKESAGRYLETKRLDDGHTLAHRVFSEDGIK